MTEAPQRRMIHGDCLDVLPTLAPGSIDACITESRHFFCARAAPGCRRHPTEKPLALMRWLVRLLCPPGGIVLDPFAGGGTTCLAALAEGRGYIGIERDPRYHAAAEAALREYVEGGNARQD